MAASATRSLVFDVPAYRSSWMNYEVYRPVLSAQIAFYSAHGKNPKHPGKSTQEFLEAESWDILNLPLGHLTST